MADSFSDKTEFQKRFNFWTALGIAICSSGSVCKLLVPSRSCHSLLSRAVGGEGWATSLAQGMTGGGPVTLM